MENEIRILGDQPKKGRLDEIMAKGDADLKRREAEEKRKELEARLGKKEAKQAKPLSRLVAPNLQYSFLGGDLGKRVDEEIRAEYPGIEALCIAAYSDDVIKGSNTFYVVAVNGKLRRQGLWTASPAELEAVIRAGALDLKSHYEDSALVLRSEEEPNAYLARDLFSQLKARGGELQLPIMLPLHGLELKLDKGSPYGLSFRLRGDSEIVYAPELMHGNNQKKFSTTNEKGLPIFDEMGSRTLYTRDSGLSRLDLIRDLVLGSYWGGDSLSDSLGDGRVVVVKTAEGGSQKI